MYTKVFGEAYDMKSCKNCICFGIEENIEQWFMAPGCAQIAACTFEASVAIYDNSGNSVTFLPVMDGFNPDVYKVGSKPFPLLLHFANRNYWITLASNQAMQALKKDNKIKSFWKRHLSFNRN
ncbi:hypothetical protein CU098_009645 [Rhizopus stolonifer]|uniref:Uncharacterized protein n=1 Tax=Rhizopus stolonifer TaxID=4846 RepID=A0A367KJE1_RHIST|nr:hypothetical protein CU098_009645 [Rhizopus stolonifer]